MNLILLFSLYNCLLYVLHPLPLFVDWTNSQQTSNVPSTFIRKIFPKYVKVWNNLIILISISRALEICYHKTTKGGMSVDTLAHWGTNHLVILCPRSELAGDESDRIWMPQSYSSMARTAAGKKGHRGSPALSGYVIFFTLKSVCMVNQWKDNKDLPFPWPHHFSSSQLWKRGLLREALAWAILFLLHVWFPWHRSQSWHCTASCPMSLHFHSFPVCSILLQTPLQVSLPPQDFQAHCTRKKPGCRQPCTGLAPSSFTYCTYEPWAEHVETNRLESRGGDPALWWHTERLWDCDEQGKLQEDERWVGKGFTSIPITLSEDGKGKWSKKSDTEEAVPYAESCLKDTERRMWGPVPLVPKRKRKYCLKNLECDTKSERSGNLFILLLGHIP